MGTRVRSMRALRPDCKLHGPLNPDKYVIQYALWLYLIALTCGVQAESSYYTEPPASSPPSTV